MAGLTALLAIAMASFYWRASERKPAVIGWPLGVLLLALYASYYVLLFKAAL